MLKACGMISSRRSGGRRLSRTESLVDKYPLQKEKILKRTIWTLVPLSLVFTALALLMASTGWTPAGITYLHVAWILFVAHVFNYFYNTLYLRNYYYDLEDDELVIGKGVVSTWRNSLPAHKIQDVYLNQDAFDRIFGLYDLHFTTASIASGEAHIDGLTRSDAIKLRSMLIGWITKTRGFDSEGDKEYLPAKAGVLMASLATVSIIALFMAFLYAVRLAPFAEDFPWLVIQCKQLWRSMLRTLGAGWRHVWAAGLVTYAAAVFFAYLEESARRYVPRDKGVFIKSGYFIPREDYYFYRNIQDVHECQGLIGKMLGIRTLEIRTMTSGSARSGRLQYLTREQCNSLRQEIQAKSWACRQRERMKARVEINVDPVYSKEKSPYQSHFIRSAHFNAGIINFICIAAFLSIYALCLLSAFYCPLKSMIVFGIIGAVLILATIYGTAMYLDAAYTYHVRHDYLEIKKDFISKDVRHILYWKVQEIILDVPFHKSLAGLADVILETGSKTGTQEITTPEHEIIPAIYEDDAGKLTNAIAERMGLSLAGINDYPMIDYIRLDAGKPMKKTLALALPLSAIAFMLMTLGAYFSINHVILPIIIGITLIISGKYLYEKRYLATYHYDINDDVLIIRKGVFGYKELIIPLTKIQDIHVSRDPYDLIFGLYDVHVSTATSGSYAHAHIDGLDAINSEAAAEVILEKMRKKSG
ncbi:PH domain-containing protein [Candidatus Altiarchaeota archaeon]